MNERRGRGAIRDLPPSPFSLSWDPETDFRSGLSDLLPYTPLGGRYIEQNKVVVIRIFVGNFRQMSKRRSKLLSRHHSGSARIWADSFVRKIKVVSKPLYSTLNIAFMTTPIIPQKKETQN